MSLFGEQSTYSETGPDPITANVFDIQRFALHDGPGIRTLVFLKGCPLRCKWCSNPESFRVTPEIALMKERCNKCGECLSSCPKRALVPGQDGIPVIARNLCDNCAECVGSCLPKALIVYGKPMSALQILSEVQKDDIFYRSSGGGLTVSGGECLLQFRFLVALLDVCNRAGIHTAIETSGFAAPAVFESVIARCDYVMFDLKHLDSRIHQELTGRPNELILNNAGHLAGTGKPFLFRKPLIPGLNDTPENVADTAAFIESLQGAHAAIELMPYHRMGIGKYQALDKPYPLTELEPSDSDHLEAVRKAYEQQGIECTISK